METHSTPTTSSGHALAVRVPVPEQVPRFDRWLADHHPVEASRFGRFLLLTPPAGRPTGR